jgi:hypothetical protein
MGQAAGVAAHLALKAGVQPRALNLHQLQQHLKSEGAWLG